MNLLKRFGYYFIGFAIGGVIVYFIWRGKDVSFDYGPDARTLKTIRIRERIYSEQATAVLTKNNLDSVAVNYILQHGDVDFGKSKQHEKPCATYYITGDYKKKEIDLIILRCDSTATIQQVMVK